MEACIKSRGQTPSSIWIANKRHYAEAHSKHGHFFRQAEDNGAVRAFFENSVKLWEDYSWMKLFVKNVLIPGKYNVYYETGDLFMRHHAGVNIKICDEDATLSHEDATIRFSLKRNDFNKFLDIYADVYDSCNEIANPCRIKT